MLVDELKGRTLFVPEMDYGGARVLAASFRSLGINASPPPPSTSLSLKKGVACTSGEECFPQQVTVGDFLDILDSNTIAPDKAAFFMPIAEGPCRFGQYATLIKSIFEERGYGDAVIYSLTSEDGYAGVGGISFVRRIFWGIVASDLLRRALLRTRPYEKNGGVTDKVYREGIADIERVLESDKPTDKDLFNRLKASLIKSRSWYEAIETYNEDFPLIGVVGEIFCRLNTFSNQDLIRHMEKMGAEAWLSGVSEWILYTNVGERVRLIEEGRRFSKHMLGVVIKDRLLKRDEHRLTHLFSDILKGREEDSNIDKLLKFSEPYLPSEGALGEMTLNVANAIYMHGKGVDGIIDISPFTCMNGIVSEAVYPRVSRDYNGLPIRIFYFDGSETNLDRDLGIFLELAKNYKRKKSSLHS